jgi:hypothetical protein
MLAVVFAVFRFAVSFGFRISSFGFPFIIHRSSFIVGCSWRLGGSFLRAYTIGRFGA